MATYYKTANILNFTELVKLDFCRIERCFKTVCVNNNFLELDSRQIAEILASSELLVAELVVLNFASKRLSYEYKERSRYAKNILLKTSFFF